MTPCSTTKATIIFENYSTLWVLCLVVQYFCVCSKVMDKMVAKMEVHLLAMAALRV